jgi:hypothetical protein
MHSPEHVTEKAQNRYRNVWRDALLDVGTSVYAVPLDPPSASVITDRADEVSAWLNLWRQWAAQHPEMTLRTRPVRTKFGNQPVHTHLDILSPASQPSPASARAQPRTGSAPSAGGATCATRLDRGCDHGWHASSTSMTTISPLCSLPPTGSWHIPALG